jgi:HK97 family phage major capsid protein
MTDFNLEQAVKPFVDDVHRALAGFEGKAASLTDVIEELKHEQAALRRGALFGAPLMDGNQAAVTPAEKAALVEFIKTGMNGTTGPTGGFGVPETIAADIEATALKLSPVRAVADVRRVDTPDYRMLVNVRGTGSGWVGETATRATTTAPSLASIAPPLGTVYALAEVTEELLGDFASNLDQFLTQDVAEHLAEQESIAFISGDGTNKPKGFTAGTVVASGDATRTFGDLQYIPTGNASTLGSDLPGKLLAMIFATKAGYRQAGAAFMASTAVIQALAELKDTQGRPLYIPSLREATPGTLLGFPLVEAEHMPAVASNSFPIAFGNWQRGYSIIDRTGLEILRDPYTKKGSVLFYIRKRVGGAVRNSEAIKLLKVASA